MSVEPTPGAAKLHATAVVVDEIGILILGPSGSGKSRLARELLVAAARERRYGALVGDDVIRATPRSGRLVVRGEPGMAGLLEVRGLGLVRCEAAEAAVVRLVVDCGRSLDRLPAPDDLGTMVAGIPLPLIAAGHAGRDADFVLWWLRGRNDAIVTVS